MTLANSLSKYGVLPRYPNEIEGDEYQAKKALTDAKQIMDWVETVVNTKGFSQGPDV